MGAQPTTGEVRGRSESADRSRPVDEDEDGDGT